MNQIPPNWELAVKHGKANLAVDASKTTLPYSDTTHCVCCQRQYPTEDDFYPLFGSGANTRLGELGEGFPILFQLMKYLTYLMVFFTIFFFIPVTLMIAKIMNANDKMKDKIKQQSPLTVFSFGSFLKFSNPQGKELVNVDDRKELIQGYLVVVMLSIFVMFLLLIYLRKKILDSSELVD